MPASSYQPSWRATKKPLWLVFGVQSRARRTVARSTGAADGDEGADGDDDVDGEAGAADGDAPDPDDGAADEPGVHAARAEARTSASATRGVARWLRRSTIKVRLQRIGTPPLRGRRAASSSRRACFLRRY
jgi:hypothetical protein